MMEIRKNSDNSIHISGYVNAAERESRVLTDATGEFVETVASGTWAKAIHNADEIGVMFNHKRAVEHRNMNIYEDVIGCKIEVDVVDEEISGAAARGELRGFSFGFSALSDEWGQREDGMRTRRLTDIRLYEVSILNCTPAYIATTIEARDETSESYEARDVEVEVNAPEVVEPDDSWKTQLDIANMDIEILKMQI